MIFGKSDDNRAKELEDRIAALEAENQKLRQALEFYANPKHWTEGHKFRDADQATIFQDKTPSVQMDMGATALKALKGK